jgi:lipopolysaccharide biosynthesis regulator YciM
LEVYWSWIQAHLLTVFSVSVTTILIYHYLIERGAGVRLSKRYRSSIFEAQSQIFLNASQYLISGNKDLAIKEFLNAVDLNRETLETYFALGELFRSNGDIEKAISIHRSLIAKGTITESMRLRALKELAKDFDKGGFIDKAIETYNDVLKINRDQEEVVLALCVIYENIEDWEQAHNYRIILSKIGHKSQSETISHILVQKAKNNFNKGDFVKCDEDLEEAFRFAPSVSAKILRLKLYLARGQVDLAKSLLFELLQENSMYASFIFISLEEGLNEEVSGNGHYKECLKLLREFFLKINEKELAPSPSIILSKVRLFKEKNQLENAYDVLKNSLNKNNSQVMKIEYIKLLVALGKNEEFIEEAKVLLEDLQQPLTRHFCQRCGYNSDDIFWRCPQCHEWETIQFRWKV